MNTLTRGLGFTLLLAGCAGPGFFSGMDAKQIEALAKIKDAAAVCVTGAGPPLTFSGKAVFASVDKDVEGSLVVGKDCEITVDTKKAK